MTDQNLPKTDNTLKPESSFASNYNLQPKPDNAAQSPAEKENADFLQERKHRALLLLSCLCLGIIFRILVNFIGSSGYFFAYVERNAMTFSIFWLAYEALFIFLNFQKFKKNRIAQGIAALCVLLVLWQILYYYFWFPQTSAQLFFYLNPLSIPLLLMMQSQILCNNVPEGKRPNLLFALAYGFFFQPIANISEYFKSFRALKTGGKGRNFVKILVGLLIGLPLLIVVLYFLSKADENFANFLDKTLFAFLRWVSFPQILISCAVVLAISALFFSFFWSIGKQPHNYALKEAKQKSNPLTSSTVLIMLLFAYLLFAIVQFQYLFSGNLPATFSYSDYARHGFGELIIVCLINLITLSIMLYQVKSSRLFRITSCSLMAANFLMVLSAALRISLYISSYGLTQLRTLALWFVGYIAITSSLYIIRIEKENFPFLKWLAIAFSLWYCLLNFVYVFLPIAS